MAATTGIVTDETGVIRIFGAGAERMLGYAAAEVVNQLRPLDLLDPLPEAIAAGIQGRYSVAFICKDMRTAGERRNLLYVDDDPASAALVEQLIARRADVQLLRAAGFNRGIELARALAPEVILVNLDLPGIGALQFLKLVRAHPGTQNTPVLALGADAAPAAIVKGLEAGFFHYLIKPMQPELFLEALSDALEFAARELEESR